MARAQNSSKLGGSIFLLAPVPAGCEACGGPREAGLQVFSRLGHSKGVLPLLRWPCQKTMGPWLPHPLLPRGWPLCSWAPGGTVSQVLPEDETPLSDPGSFQACFLPHSLPSQAGPIVPWLHGLGFSCHSAAPCAQAPSLLSFGGSLFTCHSKLLTVTSVPGIAKVS